MALHLQLLRAHNPVALMHFLLLTCMLTIGVGGRQQQQAVRWGEDDNNHYNTATNFVRIAQTISSVMEAAVNGAEVHSLVEKIKWVSMGAWPEKMAKSMIAWSTGSQKILTKVEKPVEVLEHVHVPRYVAPSIMECNQGLVAIPANVGFVCNGQNKTSLEYSLMSDYERDLCHIENGTGAVCVCPLGSVWLLRGVEGKNVCINRLLLVSPRLEDRFLCEDKFGSSLGLQRRSLSDFCLRVVRKAKISLAVNISFRWMENDEMTNALAQKGVVNVFGMPSSAVEHYITVKYGVIGSYNALTRSSKFFQFVLTPNESDMHSFGVVAGHPLEVDGSFEHLIFPFAHPELLEEERYTYQLQNKFFMEEFFGGKKNFTLHTIRRDLGKVSERFVTADGMYMEIGFSSSGIPFNHSCTRVWITFDDTAKTGGKKYTYNSSLSPAFIVAIVIVVTVVVGIVVAVWWHLCRHSHDIDDRPVPCSQKSQKEKRKTE